MTPVPFHEADTILCRCWNLHPADVPCRCGTGDGDGRQLAAAARDPVPRSGAPPSETELPRERRERMGL